MRTSLVDPALHLALAGPALLVILTAPLCWLVAPWCQWAPGRLPPPAPPPARLARLAAGAATAALALGLTGAGAVAATAPSWLAEAVAAGPLALFSLGTLATGATVAYATLAWRHRWWNLAHRVHFSAVAAALATLVAVASCYRLVGWPWFGQL
jgi:hypothetical protein